MAASILSPTETRSARPPAVESTGQALSDLCNLRRCRPQSAGVLVKEGEVGLLVTSGTFTSESKKEARNGHRCLRLIDIDEFIDLWIRYYDRMSEEDKALLPIIPVYFLKA